MRQESQFAIASRLLVLPMHVAEQLADTCLGLWAALHALAVVFTPSEWDVPTILYTLGSS